MGPPVLTLNTTTVIMRSFQHMARISIPNARKPHIRFFTSSSGDATISNIDVWSWVPPRDHHSPETVKDNRNYVIPILPGYSRIQYIRISFTSLITNIELQ